MRAVLPVLAAGVIGGIVGSSFARADEPKARDNEQPAGAVCLAASKDFKGTVAVAQEAINTQLAAGRTHLLVVQDDIGPFICAW
jgi:hypothetical protein